DEKVQKELKLTDEQLAAYRKSAPDRPTPIPPKPTPEQRQALRDAEAASAKRADAFVKDVMTPEQRKRFRQILLQRAGAAASSDEEVQEALKLSDDQKAKYKSVLQDMRKTQIDLAKAVRDERATTAERSRKADAVQREYGDKLLGLLTDEQKKVWKD